MLRIFAWPLALAALSGAGLIVALADDGVWDWLACVLLATPVVAVLWGLARPAPARK
jgi:hypothetical protein